MNEIYPSRTFQVDVAPTLEIRHLDKSFTVAGRELKVLTGVDLSVKSGEFITIVGASGCGKSTLLRLILGLDLDYSGDILVDGAPVRRPGLDRSIVFQDHRLLPWLTVEGNVAAALRRSPLSRSAKQETVREHIELVGLTQFTKAYPAQLSGGMAQRVAIARALVNRPRFLLLDGLLGASDALTRLRLQDELKRIVQHEGTTALLVTHDVDEAVGHRIVVMQPHPGRMPRFFRFPSKHAKTGQAASSSVCGTRFSGFWGSVPRYSRYRNRPVSLNHVGEKRARRSRRRCYDGDEIGRFLIANHLPRQFLRKTRSADLPAKDAGRRGEMQVWGWSRRSRPCKDDQRDPAQTFGEISWMLLASAAEEAARWQGRAFEQHPRTGSMSRAALERHHHTMSMPHRGYDLMPSFLSEARWKGGR
ncbi:ABC transporter ATP-binding protein [Sinorhizobium meliloti]|uniref:ABC transporter ATP-binding protein n=1 Tax=Rhizobium meliloti TaxID=382 RepID=UPI0013E35AEB|nr:ABC transporter ATP-binding protein [Sinorhizobium meliloti]WQO43545.1 ABC transporter ATP-binding protein [Sinorhizobium meliloti]WQO83890.1 ABC transporter ATP-binding protein [Sinorhizobium meliloti]